VEEYKFSTYNTNVNIEVFAFAYRLYLPMTALCCSLGRLLSNADCYVYYWASLSVFVVGFLVVGCRLFYSGC